MAQQTAVEWLLEAIGYKQESDRTTIINIHPDCDVSDLVKRAKQMEKEQMENMFFVGGQNGYLSCEGKPFETFEIYYNKTYGK